MQAVPQGTNMQPGSGVSVRVGAVWLRVFACATAWSILLGCGDADSHSVQERAHTLGCEAPPGVVTTPRSVDETVALANALPKPLSLPCFVEALGRPLQLHATRSEISAQPAVGVRSPRIFIYFEPLIMTVVPAGTGAHLLELGEQREGFRSLKAELHFPIAEAVPPAEPYEHTLFIEGLTACAFCHATEERDPAVADGAGYVSQSLRPSSSAQRVMLGALQAELGACDPTIEAERCALFDALLGWGPALDWDFPQDMPTFGG
jgi:hypothetical protein